MAAPAGSKTERFGVIRPVEKVIRPAVNPGNEDGIPLDDHWLRDANSAPSCAVEAAIGQPIGYVKAAG